MKPVLTADQSRRQDELATDAPSTLLERAGLSVALAAVTLGAGYGRRVAVLAGPGNNGGDGYVAAAVLRERGVAVDLHAIASPKTIEAAAARRRALAAGAVEREWKDVRQAAIVIDALFGAGFRGDLPDLGGWADLGAAVVAVDVPSGLDATTGEAVDGVLAAHRTVTFHGPKVGHLIGDGPALTGELIVADIGLPDIEPAMWLCEASDAPLPVRSRGAHKWSAGSVLVVGGSEGLDGAATLTARAALRAGAGAVMIACPPSVEDKVRAPEIMTRAIGDGPSLSGDDLPPLLDLAGRFDVVVVGPGLGGATGGLVPRLLADHEGPVLADADALNVLDGLEPLARTGPTVITPHAGEFQRLTGVAADHRAAAEAAGRIDGVVLLKGGPTFVSSPAQQWVITTGGPELATIGTGDVLAGAIAALWATGLDAATAARSGAFWHGRAGAHLQQRQTVTADALADHLAVVMRRSPSPDA